MVPKKPRNKNHRARINCGLKHVFKTSLCKCMISSVNRGGIKSINSMAINAGMIVVLDQVVVGRRTRSTDITGDNIF